MTEDYLQHYGVLGMKWGQHRARMNVRQYKYKSHRTKSYEKEAERLSNNIYADKKTAQKMRNAAAQSNKFDKKMSQYAATTTIKRTAASRVGASALAGLGLAAATAGIGAHVGGFASAAKTAATVATIVGAGAFGTAGGAVHASLSSKTYQTARVLGDNRIAAALQAATPIGGIVADRRVRRRLEA